VTDDDSVSSKDERLAALGERERRCEHVAKNKGEAFLAAIRLDYMDAWRAYMKQREAAVLVWDQDTALRSLSRAENEMAKMEAIVDRKVKNA
jgi:hypothetical protein